MKSVIRLTIPKNPHTPEIRIVKKIREHLNITSAATRQPERVGWNLGDNWHLISSPVDEFEKTIARRYELFNSTRQLSVEEQEQIHSAILMELNLTCAEPA